MCTICTGTCSLCTYLQRQREHTHTKQNTDTLILFTHSCHEQTDRFLTQVFNSNHISPPLGTVGMSTRQALSRPLCCLGSVLVYRESLRYSGTDMGMNEWQGSLKWHYVHQPALCKDAWLWAPNQTTVRGKNQEIGFGFAIWHVFMFTGEDL